MQQLRSVPLRFSRIRHLATCWRPLRLRHFAGATHTERLHSLGDDPNLEGTVINWIASEGDKVETTDVMLVVETDKVAIDILPQKSGRLIKKEGQIIKKGQPLAELETS